MQRSGFFVIHIGKPAQGSPPGAEAPARGGGVEGEEAPEGGGLVRLEWIRGQPCVTDLGSADGVLVNSTPIEPRKPFFIQDGDTIQVANVRLTWNAEAERPIRVPLTVEKEAVPSSPPLPSQAAPTYSLVVKTPSWTREIPISGNAIRIGRAPDNDIHIDDGHISRYHAQIAQSDKGYEIIDMGSVNGLRFRNARISRKLLADGDVVWLARNISLTFSVTQPAAEARVSPKEAPGPPDVGAVDRTVVVPRQAPGKAEGKTPDETVVVPKQAVTPPKVETPPEIVEPPRERAADETVVGPKRDAERVETRFEDKTVVVPRKAPKPPAVETPPESAVVPDRTAEPPADQAVDKTVVVPKQAARPAEAQDVEKTVFVRRRAKSPAPETPADTPIISGEDTERSDIEATPDTSWMDMAQFLEQDTDQVFLSDTISRNTEIPHMVVHLPDRTWEVQFTKEWMTIGRGEETDIPIPNPSVSRYHASIERRGDDFVIREGQSKNGVWLGKQRIEKHTLRDGDILSLGRAKLIFKGGFTRDDLTLIGAPSIDGKPARRPVVIVPGLMGSELWLGSERLWPNPKQLISNPEVYRLPGDPRIEARRIVSEVVILANIIKQEQYSRLGDYLETGLGYTRGKDLLEFAYDWRQDIRLASQRLADAIERWGVKDPITIIAHSLGTLVTRYYVEKLGGKRFVERIILMGGPHYGAPKALSTILIGPGILPFGMGDERMRLVLASFPSAYQILPIYPCVIDQNGRHINVLKDETWLPERQRPFLRAARSFRHELGHLSSVPSVSIFGYGLKTILRVKIQRRSDGQWGKVDFIEDMAGDLSVPSGSSVLKQSEIHPVFQEHGSLYVDDDVRMRLKVELTRSTTWEGKKRR